MAGNDTGTGTGNDTVTVSKPGRQDGEKATLTGFLQRQRDLVAWKLQGASDEVLRSVGTPTGMTIPGLVRHLVHVERSWIRDTFAGQQDLPYDWTDEDPDGEWHVPADVPVSALLADYAAESRLCDEILAAASLDDIAVHRGVSLRWILVHLIEETARHLGHLDVLREQADGAAGEDPG